ncbi:MAG: EAL domain-containing protein [Pseudohongiellaceae bacterium]
MIKDLIELTGLEHPLLKALCFAFFLILTGLVYWLVYATGGIKYVYSHSMYLVIIASAIVFGIKGGFFFALAGGIALGPVMPIDTLTGEQQETMNWLYRLGFFILVGILVGASSDQIRKYIGLIQWRLKHNLNTGLPNRFSLLEELGTLKVDPEDKPEHRLYLVFLTNLHDLELRLGYKARDVIIAQFTSSLTQNISCRIQYYQANADHIAILTRDSHHDNYRRFSRELDQSTLQPLYYEGIPILLDNIYGSVDIDGSASHPEEYLRKAEVCVIQARSRNADRLHYSPGLEEASRKNIILLGMFKEALDKNSLSLAYQPKYELGSRKIAGMEALLRWNDPDRGYIPPGHFIPIVEGSQLINPLTNWVIQQALSDLSNPGTSKIGLRKVAINISSTNLMNPHFYKEVKNLLQQYHVDPDQLEFEITETALMMDFDFCAKQLLKFSDLGIPISLDDFGTGYSSLEYLDKLPFKSVKVDQVFVRHLLNWESKQHIVRATISLAHDLGSMVVAEGIEDRETETMLETMHCDRGQGYFFSRPLPLTELIAFGESTRLQAAGQPL